ncbi:zinc-ribbon domain-containing protein [Candidatus Bathyarchaeota archaeon]|nr:zinc-ribbon domain-containing protein [Candidatus Bathyarchaeota archaeon]
MMGLIMPYCTECGSPVKDTDKFCTNCGNQIKRIKKEASRPRNITLEGTDFWRSRNFKEFMQVTAWIVDTNSTALRDMATEIVPYMRSYIVKEQDSVQITEGGGPASLYGLLFYLNWLDFIGRGSINDFGIVPDDIKISNEDLKRIENKFFRLTKAYDETLEASKSINTISSTFSDYASDLGQLLFKEDVSDIKKVRNYERSLKKFRENLEKNDLSQYPKADYRRYIEANQTGKHVTTTISAETSYGEFQYPYSYVIHDEFETDPERYISPLFSLEGIEEQYHETLRLVEECKEKSGFMKKPPEKLKLDALESLTAWDTMVLKIAASYYVAQTNYLTYDKIKRRRDDVLRYIRNHSYSETVKEIYDIVYYANLVQPVLRLISHY